MEGIWARDPCAVPFYCVVLLLTSRAARGISSRQGRWKEARPARSLRSQPAVLLQPPLGDPGRNSSAGVEVVL